MPIDNDPALSGRERTGRLYPWLVVLAVVILLSIAAGAGLILLMPTAADKAARFVAEGAALEAEGKDLPAAAAYNAALAADKENTAARRALVPNLIRRGLLERAALQLQALLERSPNDPDLNLQLAELAISRFDGQGALPHLALAQGADPERIHAAASATRYFTSPEGPARATALADCEAIVEKAPSSLPAAIVVVSAAMQDNGPDYALPVADDALGSNPRSVSLNLLRFDLLNRMPGKAAAAGDAARALYAQFPDNREVLRRVRDWMMAHGSPDEAVAVLRDLAARTGDRPDDHAALAAYVVAHYPDRASVPVLDGLAAGLVDQALADGYRVRAAEVRFDQGEIERAIAILRKIVKAAPPEAGRSLPLGALARMLAATGQRTEALQAAEKAAALDPKNVEAQLVRAGLALDRGDGGRAVDVARQALAATPDDPGLLVALARGYEAQDMAPLALRAMAQAVDVTKNGPAESRALIELLLKSGNRAMAETVLQAALRANPGNADLLALAAPGLIAPP